MFARLFHHFCHLRRVCILLVVSSALGWAPDACAANILFVVSDQASPANADPGIIELLQSLGHEVTLFAPPNTTQDQQQEAALGADLVLVSETIGSAAVVFDDVFSLKTIPVPVISFEPFMWDNADWTGRSIHVDFGNTGRSEAEPIGLGDLRDSIYITDPDHPLAAGFSGQVTVYVEPYSVNFGVPSSDAHVVATADEAGEYATLFVYEEGDFLADGSETPAARIGLFMGQTAAPNANFPLRYDLLTDDAITLIMAAVEWALEPVVKPPRPPTNLALTPGSRQMGLAWSAPAGEPKPAAYTVLRSGVPAGPYTQVVELPASERSYTDRGLEDERLYCYVVRSKLDQAESGNSNEACAKTLPGGVRFRRGDADSNGLVELTDAVRLLSFLFLGQVKPECLDAADTDDDGKADISDAISSLNYQFLGGLPPAPPGPTTCGPDPTAEAEELGCDKACP